MYANAFNTNFTHGETLTKSVPIIYTVFHSDNNYNIDLTSPIRDVVSIELIRAVIPTGVHPVNGVNLAPDPYVTLYLNGYSRITSNNNDSTGGFCNIYSDIPGWYTYNRAMQYESSNIYYFPEPTRLQRLNISISEPAHPPVVVHGTTLNYHNHVLTFEIKTLL